MKDPPQTDSVPAEVHCVREVRASVALERAEEVERFYAEVLGLPPWPATAQVPGGRGLGDPQRGLYLQYRHDPTVDPLRPRFTLVVPSLDDLGKRLSERGWPYERYHGFSATDQWMVVTDPVGQVIQVRQSQRLA